MGSACALQEPLEVLLRSGTPCSRARRPRRRATGTAPGVHSQGPDGCTDQRLPYEAELVEEVLARPANLKAPKPRRKRASGKVRQHSLDVLATSAREELPSSSDSSSGLGRCTRTSHPVPWPSDARGLSEGTRGSWQVERGGQGVHRPVTASATMRDSSLLLGVEAARGRDDRPSTAGRASRPVLADSDLQQYCVGNPLRMHTPAYPPSCYAEAAAKEGPLWRWSSSEEDAAPRELVFSKTERIHEKDRPSPYNHSLSLPQGVGALVVRCTEVPVPEVVDPAQHGRLADDSELSYESTEYPKVDELHGSLSSGCERGSDLTVENSGQGEEESPGPLGKVSRIPHVGSDENLLRFAIFNARRLAVEGQLEV